MTQPPSPLKPLFACPFLKNNPAKYGGPVWKCHERGLSRIRDVKQHLERRHSCPLHCIRCFQQFRTEEELAFHVRVPTPCAVVGHPEAPDGITNEQKAQFKKSPSRLANDYEAQWFHLYQIVFPNHKHLPPATAYLSEDGYQDVAAYQDFIMKECPRIFANDFPDVDAERLHQRVRGALQVVNQEWAQRGCVRPEAPLPPAIDWSTSRQSSIENTPSTYSSPASETYPYSWQSISTFDVNQGPIAESAAVRGVRSDIRKDIYRGQDGTIAMSYGEEHTDLIFDTIPEQMWHSEDFPDGRYTDDWL